MYNVYAQVLWWLISLSGTQSPLLILWHRAPLGSGCLVPIPSYAHPMCARAVGWTDFGVKKHTMAFDQGLLYYCSFKNILSYKYFVAYMASSWRIFLNIIYSKNVKKKSRFERINLLLQFLKQCRTIQWPIFQPCKSERHFTCINSCNIYM